MQGSLKSRGHAQANVPIIQKIPQPSRELLEARQYSENSTARTSFGSSTARSSLGGTPCGIYDSINEPHVYEGYTGYPGLHTVRRESPVRERMLLVPRPTGNSVTRRFYQVTLMVH